MKFDSRCCEKVLNIRILIFYWSFTYHDVISLLIFYSLDEEILKRQSKMSIKYSNNAIPKRKQLNDEFEYTSESAIKIYVNIHITYKLFFL